MLGRLLEIGRFPIKSMLGESPDRASVDAAGLVGDRASALFDVATGKIASAKDPRVWARLLGLRATYPGEARSGARVEITLSTGEHFHSDDADTDVRLSAAIGRAVRLTSVPSSEAKYDYVWEVDGIAPKEVVSGSQTGQTEEGRPISTMPMALMAPGTFQDVAPITIMTTAALAAMAKVHPRGRWEQPRFRNNFVLDVEGEGCVENQWLGRRIAIGSALLEVTSPAPRCVMTTLAQAGLPRDVEILRTVARENQLEFAGFGKWACLGVYAKVIEPGEVGVGDAAKLC